MSLSHKIANTHAIYMALLAGSFSSWRHGESGLKIVQVSFRPAYNKKINDIK